MKHENPTVPSLLLALVALAVVQRFSPAWTAVSVAAAAREHGQNPERISRLASRITATWEGTLARLATPGRPPVIPCLEAELALTRELLAVATELLRQLPKPPGALTTFRALVVGAWLRLRDEYPSLTQQRFCATLALSTRTFRSWSVAPARPPSPTRLPPAAPPKRRRQRGPRRRRFTFDCVVPDTQLAADTTDLVVCGVPLKLLAAQDVGGRDEELLDSVLIDDHESSALVVEVLTAALDGREGLQVIVDQGTPYMAKNTVIALEELGAEHAPQPEGTPTAKATIERAFRSLKDIIAPVVAITNDLAARIPQLRDQRLAIGAARVLVTLALRAYQAGSRAQRAATNARGDIDPTVLAAVADQARDRARSLEDSRRRFLQHLHELYDFERGVTDFVRLFSQYSLPVLQDAERAFRGQVHRDDLRHRRAYFGAIVRRVADDHRATCRRRTELDATEERLRRDTDEQRAIDRARRRDPLAWFREALDALAGSWLPEQQALLFGGAGLGQGWLSAALALLRLRHSPVALQDLVSGALADFAHTHHDRLGDTGITAVANFVRRQLPDLHPNPHHHPSAPRPPPATLPLAGRTMRPPAQLPLRI